MKLELLQYPIPKATKTIQTFFGIFLRVSDPFILTPP